MISPVHREVAMRRGRRTQQSAEMGIVEVSSPDPPFAVKVNFCSPTPMGILKICTPAEAWFVTGAFPPEVTVKDPPFLVMVATKTSSSTIYARSASPQLK